MPRDTQHPCEGKGQKWATRLDQIFLSRSPFPGLFDHSIIARGIRTTNLTNRIINFQGTCDPCRHSVLLLRPQTIWMEAPSLARSWKLQEHVWEQGGALVPGTSLRLEVILLAGCFRVQSPKSKSLSWLYLWSMWVEALLVTMRFLNTQIGNCRIWSAWNCGRLPLVVLALSRPEKALQWLVPQLPRYSSCGICGKELDGMALVTWGPKSLFPHWLTLHSPFCYHIYWCGDTQKRHLGFFVHLFITQSFYCGQDYSGMCTGTWNMDASPRKLAWETSQESYSAPPQVASEEEGKPDKGLNGEELDISLGCHQVYPGASPPHLGG